MRAPRLPSNAADPAGIDKLERGAMLALAARLRKCAKAYIAVLGRIPAALAVNARYAFEIDPSLLMALLNGAALDVDDILLEGGQDNLWFTQAYGGVAYQRGTAQQIANLAQQSPAYAAERANLASVINSQEYRLRIGLVKARQFEEMKGLTGDVQAAMSRVLTDGMARGLNPLAISKSLQEQAALKEGRANNIARTEIGTAHKRAKWDEADSANQEFATNTKEMYISALSPTTRPAHAARHGTLHSTEEMRDWFSKDGNSNNCKCTTASVLVDKDGNALFPQVQERARATYKKNYASLQ